MNETRSDSACTNYEGKIVIADGHNNMMRDNNGYLFAEKTNSVEIYDRVAHGHTWTRMSRMVQRKSYHILVSVKSKLFVIGLCM